MHCGECAELVGDLVQCGWENTVANSPWTLTGHVARLSAGEFSATVNVERPGLGIHDIAWAGRRIDALRNWLALAEDGTKANEAMAAEEVRAIEDCYVRGRDLVAVYAETKDHPLRYVVYWRALGADELCGAAAGLDVVVSVQTSVLDVTPKVWLGSACDVDAAWSAGAAGSAWRPLKASHGEEGDHAYLLELAGGEWCAAEMIHSQDRIESTARLAGDTLTIGKAVQTRHQVLGLRLEKGVLLRARMRALLVRCDNRGADEARTDNAREVVAQCRKQFERGELPLTT
jgi:hypothetical protein